MSVRFRYYIEPTTSEPHIHNHGVSENEVEEVMADPGEDFAGADGARVAIGQTLAGRYLRVIYVAEGRDVFVITAYDLGNRALWAYRRRRRRKQ